MILRSLRAGEQDACLDLWDCAFTNTPRDYFERYFTDLNWRLDDTVVCEEDGKLVSAVHVVRRTVETRTGHKSMAGIANVGTLPEFRSGGRSTACLTETIQRMEADSTLDFSLLGTGIPDYYARLGWVPWKLRYWEGENPFLGKAPCTESVRPAVEEDLDRIVAWHTEHHRNLPIAVVRDQDYWRNWMHWTPSGYLVGESGYARVRETPQARIVVARTEGFPWQAAFGTTSERVRLCLPITEAQATGLLNNATSAPWGGLMIRTLRDQPLPDLTDADYLDGDGF